MPTFGTSEWFADQAPKGLTVIWIPRYPRKDGKYLVTYCYTARNIKSLLTPEKLDAVKASGHYEIRIK